MHRPIRVAYGLRHRLHPARAKDSKTMGFGGVLWVLSAAAGRKYLAEGMTASAVRGDTDVPVAVPKISALPYGGRLKF